jgi:serine/threonine-protein kinase
MPEAVDQVAQQLLKAQTCTPEQVQEGLDIQQKMRDMGISPKPLPEILFDKGYLTKDQLRDLMSRPAQEKSTLDRDSIPGFELLTKVGQGGMGAVFKARQVSMDRIVALKVLPPRLAKDANFRERFLREARAVAKLNHENIIQGIDVGVANGLFYFVMEFVDGLAVSKVLNTEKKLEEKRSLTICAQIARALEHAHRHKMVHRDVKPENIMLTADGIAKLCDLGLAKREEGDAGLTQAGLSVGTPNYISPEQARGEGDVDIRSDIYSLGASLYHIVTGQVPFDGTVPSVVMTKHITEDLVPPMKLRPDLSPEANAIVMKSMQKKREDRYQLPEQMAQDLEAVVAGRPLMHARVAGQKRGSLAPGAMMAGAAPAAAGETGRKPGLAHAAAQKGAPSWVMPIAIAAVLAVAILGGVFAMTRGDKEKEPVGEGPAKAEKPVGPKDTDPKEAINPVPLPANDKIEAAFKALTGFIEMHKDDPSKHREIENRLDEFLATHKKTEWELKAFSEQKKYREGLDGSAARLLAKITGDVAPLRQEGKFHAAMEAAGAAWPKHLSETPTAKKHGELLVAILGEMQAAWKRDEEKAKGLADKREFKDALASLDGVAVYGSPEIQSRAAALRSEIEGKAAAWATELATIGRRRFDAEFMPPLEKLLAERKYADALKHCGKFRTDPEMFAMKDAIGALIDDITALNLVFEDAARGADSAIQTKTTLRFGNLDVKVTKRDGERVSYSFVSGGSSELSFLKAEPDDMATLCQLGFSTLPADRKAAERGAFAFRLGLLFYYTPKEKDKKRAGEELDKADKEGVARAKFYLGKLGDRALSETELAAKKLWEEANDAFGAKRFAEAKAKYKKLLDDMGSTAWVKGLRDTIVKKIAECDGGGSSAGGAESSGLQKLLKGTVVRTYSKGQVEVKYDFAKADQVDDWQNGDGKWTWDKDAQALHGVADETATRGPAWIVPLNGDVSIEMDLTPLADKNIGIGVCNDRTTKGYVALFGGVFTPEIMRALGSPDLKSAALAKLIAGGQPPIVVLKAEDEPKLVRGTPTKVRVSRAEKRIVMYVGGKKVLEGTDDELTWGHVSLLLVASEARFDEITIFGKPDERWLRDKLGGK